MGIYAERVLPHLIHAVCGTGEIREQRERVVPLASGRVLEVGMGSGLNLPLYDRERVEMVWGLEPSAGMRRKAAPAVEASDLDVRLIDLPGEEIPLDDDSVDTVVLTYVLCTIPDWRAALDQVRRVLRADGRVVFAEHGLAPDAPVQRWQHRLNPVWRRLAGGCNLNRPIVECLEASGFVVESVHHQYRGRPKSASFMSWGICAPS